MAIVGRPTLPSCCCRYPRLTELKISQENGPWHPDPVGVASFHHALSSPLSGQRTRRVLSEASGGMEALFEVVANLANHRPKRELVHVFCGAALTTPPAWRLMLSQCTRVSSESRRLLTGSSAN